MALHACKGFEILVGGYDEAHELLYQRDAEIEELEEKLRQLNARCDSVELIVNGGDAVEGRFESLIDSEGKSCGS